MFHSELTVIFRFRLCILFLPMELLCVSYWQANGRCSCKVTVRDKQVLNFTHIYKVPDSMVCCLSELHLSPLRMYLVYNYHIFNKCAELRQQKKLWPVSVWGAFRFLCQMICNDFLLLLLKYFSCLIWCRLKGVLEIYFSASKRNGLSGSKIWVTASSRSGNGVITNQAAIL